jgi:uncharacterized membrane protein
MIVSSQPIADRRQQPRWLLLLLLSVIVVSICFRFTHLERRFYWNDEAVTGLRTAGYQIGDFKSQFDNRIIDFSDLQIFQQPKPGAGLGATIQSLAIEDAKHPPLYSIIVWIWRRLFGDAILGIRILSVIISLFLFPAVYWLTWELFASRPIAALATAFVALSPVHLLYAQEARAYSLWTVAIVASSAALLWAMRSAETLVKHPWQRYVPWLVYIILAIVGTYTQTLFGLVLAAHLIYVAIQGWRNRGPRYLGIPAVIGIYLASLGAIVAAFIPWLQPILQTQTMLKATTGWVLIPLPKLTIVKHWLVGLSAMFLDWDGWMFADITNGTDMWESYLPRLLIVSFAIGAIGFLCRTAPARAWLFLISLIGTFVGFLMLPDLITGGQRSISARYFLGVYVALQIAMAYLFSRKIQFNNGLRQSIWKLMLGLLIALQIASCGTIVQSQVWWNKNVNIFAVTQMINRSPHPLVITESGGMNPGTLIAMSYAIKPGVKLQLADAQKIPAIPPGFSDVYIFTTGAKSPTSIHSSYEQAYGLSAISVSEQMLWKMQGSIAAKSAN